MDDIENLIYILFVLISLISGVWKNRSKQKEEKERRAAVEQSMAEDEFEQTAWQPQAIKPADLEKENEAARRLAEMEKKAAEARANRRLKRRTLLNETENIPEVKPTVFAAYNRNFDAKKAVIYSEILNPPYL